MKIRPGSRRSKNVIDLRDGACSNLKSPAEEMKCLEKRIAHRENVEKNRKKGKKMQRGRGVKK